MRDNDEEIKWLENSITRRRLITLIISIFTFGVLLWIFLSLPFLPNASLQLYLTIAAAVVSLSLCVLYMKIVLPAQVGISHNGIYVLISKKNNWKKFVSWDDIVSIRPDIFDNYELRGVGRRFLWVNKAVRDELEGPLRIFLKEKEFLVVNILYIKQDLQMRFLLMMEKFFVDLYLTLQEELLVHMRIVMDT